MGKIVELEKWLCFDVNCCKRSCCAGVQWPICFVNNSAVAEESIHMWRLDDHIVQVGLEFSSPSYRNECHV
jgi:hypothetical protein